MSNAISELKLVSKKNLFDFYLFSEYMETKSKNELSLASLAFVGNKNLTGMNNWNLPTSSVGCEIKKISESACQ